MSEKSGDPILVPNTRWIVFTFILCEDSLVFEKNKKQVHFLLKKASTIIIIIRVEGDRADLLPR